jgi:hypothetical protein
LATITVGKQAGMVVFCVLIVLGAASRFRQRVSRQHPRQTG